MAVGKMTLRFAVMDWPGVPPLQFSRILPIGSASPSARTTWLVEDVEHRKAVCAERE